jgi:hypothetical protein
MQARAPSRAGRLRLGGARDDDQGHAAPAGLLAQRADERGPVHLGHDQVEHDGIRALLAQRTQRLPTVADAVDRVAFQAQGIGDHAPHGRVVVDDQNAGHAAAEAQLACQVEGSRVAGQRVDVVSG